MKNLHLLRLKRNFEEANISGVRQVRLVLHRDETKNNMLLEFPLPEETVGLLDRYVEHHLPNLRRTNRKGYLFPGSIDGHIHPTELGRAVRRAVQCYVGVKMTVHCFRHLAVKFLLERFPHRYDLAALLLGHKSEEITRNFYSALEMGSVARQYSADVLGRSFSQGALVYANRRELEGTSTDVIPLFSKQLRRREKAQSLAAS
jgi:integrase